MSLKDDDALVQELASYIMVWSYEGGTHDLKDLVKKMLDIVDKRKDCKDD